MWLSKVLYDPGRIKPLSLWGLYFGESAQDSLDSGALQAETLQTYIQLLSRFYPGPLANRLDNHAFYSWANELSGYSCGC